jgi:KaiC/GvpD/RAD55 family RecA-like ATPase
MALISLGYDGLPRDSLVLVEEELGDVKRVFIQMIGAEAIAQGKKVTYITFLSRHDMLKQSSAFGLKEAEQFEVVEKFNDGSRLHEVCTGDLCIIDGFPLMNMDADGSHIIARLRSLLQLCTGGRIIIAASDMGVLSEREEKAVRAMSDGIIQFNTEKGEDHISHFINVPKMRGLPPADKQIPFTVEENGISIDTRERFA